MTHTIFYSWQSDIRAAANRSLIQGAIEKAVEGIRGPAGETIINPVIDRDTAGVPGSPDISSTILEKIDSSSVLVADVSLVDQGGTGNRRFPNPNVLIEVGYAIKSLGFSRILLVQNVFNGSIENLPFDLRGKRVMTYSSDPSDNSRAEQRDILARQLKNGLMAILPILEDVSTEDNQEVKLDSDKIRRQIDKLIVDKPIDIEQKLGAIKEEIISSPGTPPETKADLLNRITLQLRRKSVVSPEFLYEVTIESVQAHPTSSAYFDMGLIAAGLGKPFDSISAYMKAIELKAPNPSLCFLNAGNRYREMNDVNIALAFYEKALELNPKQANAWLAAAQLSDQKGNANAAKDFYNGFLEWFNNLEEGVKNDSRKQQAEHAENYIRSH